MGTSNAFSCKVDLMGAPRCSNREQRWLPQFLELKSLRENNATKAPSVHDKDQEQANPGTLRMAPSPQPPRWVRARRHHPSQR
ncbi:hypothetical protein VTH06DRAFT_8512 [Thermothelomyces fergusii]